jgi:signal transduction histidine kinase
MKQQVSLLQKIFFGILIFAGLGILGALPAGFLGLMGGTQVASEIYILAALVIASWFPLKVLVDRFVKGQTAFNLPSIKLNMLSLTMIGIGSLVLIPVLYYFTFIAFLSGLFAYLIAGNSLAIALLTAFAVQSFSIYQAAQKEKELGVTNNLFVRFQDMNMSSNYDISLDAESSRAAQQAYDDTPDMIFLPAERLQQFNDEDDYDDEDENMTITIDPEDSQSELDES